MRSLIVHCHPEAQSFNAALTETAVDTLRDSGASVQVSDLYAEGFNPVEGPEHYRDRQSTDFFSALAEQRHAGTGGSLPTDVKREIDRLEQADLVIFQFPLWWHGPPAMLKGWFDRVFVSGYLYTSSMRYDRGYFRGKRALCAFTSGAPEESFGPGSRGGDPDRILWPIHYSLHYMGFTVLEPFTAFGVQGHGYQYQDAAAFQAQMESHKTSWAQRLRALDTADTLRFPGWDDWDDVGRAI